MIPTEEQIHEASRGYCGAFDHMLHDWKPVAGFKAGAKWAISQMEQDDVIEKVNPICPYCGKYKTTQGNGILHQLCECGNTDIPSLYVIEKVKELKSHYAELIKVADIAIHSTKGQYETREHFQIRIDNLNMQKQLYYGFYQQLNAIIEKP